MKCQLFFPHNSSVSKGLYSSHQPVALCPMGNGHRGSSASSSGEQEFFVSSNRLIHEMGGGYIIKFIRRNILSRFGIPRAFVSNNKTQFIGQKVKNLLRKLNIKFYNSTLSYPQYNGQAETTNKTIMNGIKKRLKKAKGKWDEELPNVLWAYQTTPQRARMKHLMLWLRIQSCHLTGGRYAYNTN